MREFIKKVVTLVDFLLFLINKTSVAIDYYHLNRIYECLKISCVLIVKATEIYCF